jgi:hypothetical protein
MSYRLTRISASTPYENADEHFRGNGKTKIARTLHIVFFLWLVVSVALILTAISQRRAIIELLKTGFGSLDTGNTYFSRAALESMDLRCPKFGMRFALPYTRRETAC